MAMRHAAIGTLQSIPRTRWLGGYTVFGHSGVLAWPPRARNLHKSRCDTYLFLIEGIGMKLRPD